jgi:hypothetical protein
MARHTMRWTPVHIRAASIALALAVIYALYLVGV